MKYFVEQPFVFHLSFDVELDIDFVDGIPKFVVDRTHNLFHIHALIGYHIRKFLRMLMLGFRGGCISS